MNIILIGYRCCGKTSTGRLIAERLERRFVDTDGLIVEKAGSSIDEMVSKHGWEYFRDIEKKVVKDVSLMNNLVIATGGGVVINKENIDNLKSNGYMIWLSADIEVIRKRLEGDISSSQNRPSLTGDDPLDEVARVLEERNPLYSNANDFAVDTGKLNIDEVVDVIIKDLYRKGVRA